MKQYSLILSLFLTLLMPAIVLAAPGIPHQFYGDVTFDRGTTPDGLLVEAKVGGIVVGTNQTKDGKYGYNPSLFFAVNADGDWTGEIANFFVYDIDTGETFALTKGGYKNFNLTVPGSIGILDNAVGTVVTDEAVVVIPDTPTVVNIGSDLSVSLSPSGTSGTNAVIDKIEKLESGNVAILAGNDLLNAYEIKVTGKDLSITVTMKYDDSAVDENTIKPYIFDGSNWVEITLPAPVIDKVANTLTFTISSAQTPYAIFGETVQAAVTPVVTPGGGSPGGGSSYTTAEDTTSTSLVGDINGNSTVDKYDFALMMSTWGQTEVGLAADLNSDGKVDKYDFSLLMVNWSI